MNYNGPLGYGSRTYWEEGLYRHTAPEVMAADFRNLTITTGSLSAPTGPTQPSTPTQPTTPTVTPAVTQATASPGTGTEHVGDTITLSLGFNEAVTVTGTPTLSLNDGGKATYVGGSGTGTLTFKTTVASTNTSTSALAITGVNLPSGASIKDASGVAASFLAQGRPSPACRFRRHRPRQRRQRDRARQRHRRRRPPHPRRSRSSPSRITRSRLPAEAAPSISGRR